jgi:hypothetical protein
VYLEWVWHVVGDARLVAFRVRVSLHLPLPIIPYPASSIFDSARMLPSYRMGKNLYLHAEFTYHRFATIILRCSVVDPVCGATYTASYRILHYTRQVRRVLFYQSRQD